jgi:AraC-like DNA-binding protein
MRAREHSRRSAGPARGVLRSDAAGRTEHRRVLPSQALVPFVAHFWSVRWSLDQPFTAETLPHPCVHVVFEEHVEIAGVATKRFTRRLEGEGGVFGIKFRPAAFRALYDAPMNLLTDRVVPAADVLGLRAAETLGRALGRARELDSRIEAAEAFLAPRLAALAPEIARLRDLVERLAIERTLRRAADAADALGVDLRTLQRRFREHVGVSPKWVIQRYRLHEAAEQLKMPNPPSLAALAADLGYADQAHFARDFKRMIGTSPQTFRHSRASADLPR